MDRQVGAHRGSDVSAERSERASHGEPRIRVWKTGGLTLEVRGGGSRAKWSEWAPRERGQHQLLHRPERTRASLHRVHPRSSRLCIFYKLKARPPAHRGPGPSFTASVAQPNPQCVRGGPSRVREGEGVRAQTKMPRPHRDENSKGGGRFCAEERAAHSAAVPGRRPPPGPQLCPANSRPGQWEAVLRMQAPVLCNRST